MDFLAGLPWGWAVFFAVIACMAFLLAAGGTMVVAWLTPRQREVAEGKKQHTLVTTYKWCCPPGLGCNERDRRTRPCRREVALELADLEETQQLNHLWARLHGSPSRETLAAWEGFRDDLLQDKIATATDVKGKNLLGVSTARIEAPTVEVGTIESGDVSRDS